MLMSGPFRTRLLDLDQPFPRWALCRAHGKVSWCVLVPHAAKGERAHGRRNGILLGHVERPGKLHSLGALGGLAGSSAGQTRHEARVIATG